jgi:hypothetical protein
MKHIEIKKLNSSAEDCTLFEKCLQRDRIPFNRIERESSGTIVVWVEDGFAQAATDALRQEVLKLNTRLQVVSGPIPQPPQPIAPQHFSPSHFCESVTSPPLHIRTCHDPPGATPPCKSVTSRAS